MFKKALLAGVSTSVLLVATSMASAQSAPANNDTSAAQSKGGLEEIVVTARRRSESLQSVPETVQAITGESLKQAGAKSLGQVMQQISGVTFAQVGGAQPVLGMRGDFNRLGAIEPAIGVFVDGVYQNRYTQIGHGPVDAVRVEVARGPQTTLYGRNTLAGAINVITNDPTSELSGEIEAGGGGSSVGGERLWHVQGILSGPIAGERLTGRLVVLHQERDGYLYDKRSDIRALGYKATTVRGKLLFHATDNFDTKLTVSYFHDNAPRAEFNQFYPGVTIPLVRTVAGVPIRQPIFSDSIWDAHLNVKPFSISKAFNASIQFNWDMPIGKIEAISSYAHSSVDQLTDTDATQYSIAAQNFIDRDESFQQDIRLQNKVGGLTYLVGLYYIHDSNSLGVTQNFFADSGSAALAPPAGPVARQFQNLSNGGIGYAAYGQIGYDITDALNFTGGLRWGYDKRIAPFDLYNVKTDGTFSPGAIFDLDRRHVFRSVTGDFTASYKLDPDVMVFARYARGDKSGGFGTVADARAAAIPYSPEKLDAYEVGLKAEFFDRRVRLNISGYYNKFKDIQLVTSVPNPFNPGATINVVQNAGSANVPGVDMDFSALLTDKLRLNINYSYLDAQITSFKLAPGQAPGNSLKGQRLPRTPQNTFSVGLNHTSQVGDGELSLGAQYYHSDKFNTDFGVNAAAGVIRTAPQQGYDLVNLTGSYEIGSWTVSAYMRNLFNKEYVVTSTLASVATYTLAVPGEPRTFELTLRRRF
jgi:iron complex outermembrane receptor protein